LFVMENWRPGAWGALRMGLVHGAWCVGCCWALMGALFTLGVMSLGWMALIAGLIAAEKLWPWRTIANYGVAAVLLILAIALAVDSVGGARDAGGGWGAMQGDPMTR